jgi:hypothetical protein
LERFKAIFLIGGIAFFLFSYAVMGLLPSWMFRHVPVRTLEQLSRNVSEDFVNLSNRYPETFAKYYGSPGRESFARALKRGRDVYIAEGCWHCHSQFVRPVSNEATRFGPVSTALEGQNVLQMPVMYGTRRVGPDLSREAGKHTIDWQAAHLFQPTNVVPVSVMPSFPWFFERVAGRETPLPNRDGIAILTYVQWLGTDTGVAP